MKIRFRKEKIIFYLKAFFISSILSGVFIAGFKLGELKMPKIEYKTIEVVKLVDYNDPEIFEDAVSKASEKYKIKKEVFYAIRDCEGGQLWAWNRTQDGGYFQIHWKTAKAYGAKTLEDIINPYKSADLAAKIIKQEGLKAWAKNKCIIDKIISLNVNQKD